MSGYEFLFEWDEWDVLCLEQLFSIKDKGSSFQELRFVPLRQGCLITFPNCLPHRLESFELVDKARPGHSHFLPYGSLIPITASVQLEMSPRNARIGGNRKHDPI